MQLKFSQALTALFVLLIVILAIYSSTLITTDSVFGEIIIQWGYIGVALLGLISGLNAIVPIPAAALTPLFTEAGLLIPGIIAALVIGTMIADYIGFLFGRSTRELIENRYPKLTLFLQKLVTNHSQFLLPFVALYAAVLPFPNEAILIPLAFTGIPFKKLCAPLLIGNTINQTYLVYGVDWIKSLIT